MKGIMMFDQPETATEMRVMRKRSNLWILGLIFGLAVLFYVVTIVRMSL
jgi:hypothetical protein